MKTFEFENCSIILGENAKENWEIFDTSNSEDYFFHLSRFPSGYVALKNCEVLNNNLILKCAEICKQSTKYRNMKNIKVDYCKFSNLKKGEKKGEVIFLSNRKVKQVNF